jgi:ATP-dependent 26S proteasome regulatory subunit
MEDIIEINVDKMSDIEELEDNSNKASIWVKDKEYYLPSTDISIYEELPPGMYKVSYSNDKGYNCKQIEINSDELFMFSDAITKSLIDEIQAFWDKKDLYEKNKLIHKRGILLAGYAGTGKTTIINIISQELIKRGGIVFKVDGVNNLSNYVDFIQYGFRRIQKDTPVITILEDIDQYSEIEADLLDFLDGQFHLNHHLVIATSNNTEDIPETFLRPSRLDLKIEIGYPSKKTREEYFRYKNVPEEDIDHIVEVTKDCSLADLKEVFICVYILGYDLEKAVDQVLNPTDKKNYTNGKYNRSKIGF